MTEPDEIIYLAGITDGEGTITTLVNKYSHKHYIYPRFCIHMSERGALDIFARLFGGNITSYQPKGPKYKLIYGYDVAGTNKVKIILEKISPYLTVKRRQANLTLDLIRLLNTKAPFEQVSALSAQIRSLNDH
ncbi:MAG: hypothetical protein R2685_10540 [Candidatus Nitrosocosmicus sp.]|nr:hypothetical protein [Candidatus Nitrosocosmicus sp.]